MFEVTKFKHRWPSYVWLLHLNNYWSIHSSFHHHKGCCQHLRQACNGREEVREYRDVGVWSGPKLMGPGVFLFQEFQIFDRQMFRGTALTIFAVVLATMDFIVSLLSTDCIVVGFGTCGSFLGDKRGIGYPFYRIIGVQREVNDGPSFWQWLLWIYLFDGRGSDRIGIGYFLSRNMLRSSRSRWWAIRIVYRREVLRWRREDGRF